MDKIAKLFMNGSSQAVRLLLLFALTVVKSKSAKTQFQEML